MGVKSGMSSMFVYHDGKSFMHKTHPLIKMMWMLSVVLLVIVAGSIPAVALVTLYIFAIALLSKVDMGKLFSPVYLLFLAIIMFFHLLFLPYPFQQSLVLGALVLLRISAVVFATQIVSWTTHPKEWVNALAPYSKTFAFIMDSVLRFLPDIEREANKIIEAQRARALNIFSKNPLNFVQNSIPILVPLFGNSLEKAENLALALECRGFDIEKLRYERRDKLLKEDLITTFSFIGIAALWLGVAIAAV
jgi:energy-coupling factor transport system permease protein